MTVQLPKSAPDPEPRRMGAAPMEGARPSFSLIGLANILLRNARVILLVTGGVMLAVLLLTLLRGADFVAQSRFRPQTQQSQLSRFSGLAAQFGIDLQSAPDVEPLEFYAEVATSPDLLLRLAQSRFEFEAPNGVPHAGLLADLLEAEGDTEAERTREAIQLLEYRVTARPDPKAGIITLRTTAPWPSLAAQMNRRLLELMNEFNLNRRQSAARAEREFVERRLAEAQSELQEAEAQLQEFMSRNVRFETPDLRLQSQRLERRVDLQSQLYTSLAQSYEQARIVEVRNTPVITLIDAPETLVKRAGGSLLVNLVLAMIVGSALGGVAAVLREYLARERVSSAGEYAEFHRLVDRYRRRLKLRRGRGATE